MKYDIAAALQALKPGAEWVLRGSEYSGLEWLDKSQTAPSESDIATKITAMDNAEATRLLRVERDAKLAALDWEVTKAHSKGEAVASELATYMQALRDLPASASPTTDSNGELVASSVTWPTR
jgi:hypothetical protein